MYHQHPENQLLLLVSTVSWTLMGTQAWRMPISRERHQVYQHLV